MASIPIGAVVFVRFPFSDLSQYKKRPALVLADVGRDDLILCQITSQPYTDKQAIVLKQNSFISGSLIKISYVRPGKIFTANISIVEKVVAQVKSEIRQAVINRITELLNMTD